MGSADGRRRARRGCAARASRAEEAWHHGEIGMGAMREHRSTRGVGGARARARTTGDDRERMKMTPSVLRGSTKACERVSCV